MNCPICPDTPLVMSERQGVEIDYCPACRGIWLDRGELDKLLDRAVTAGSVAAPASVQASQQHRHRDFEDSDYHHGPHSQRGRKKSWLSEFFD